MDFGVPYENEWVAAAASLFIVLWGLALARVPLPHYIRNLFNNTIFKIVFLSLLIVFGFNKSPQVAIVVALIFVLTLQFLREREVKENFEYYEQFVDELDNQSE